VTTNQRICFDISSDGKYLVSGNCTGDIRTWQLDQQIDISDEAESVLTLNSTISVHDDCVNGVSLHPTCPLLVTTSGQRHNEFDDDEPALKKDIDISLKLWKII